MAHPRPLRLGSYNIRKCVGLDWRRSPERTLDVVAGMGADVVALQEADKRLGPRPSALPRHEIAARTGMTPLIPDENAPSLGHHGNAILVGDGVDVLNLRGIDLPGTEPRGALIAKLRPTGADHPIHVVAAHLGLMRRDRQRQLHAIRAALLDSTARVFIMGDFNEWSRTRGLDPLTPDMSVISPGHSFHAARPIAGLDRVAHCGASQLQDAGVIESKLARKASDHLPIWADFTLTP